MFLNSNLNFQNQISSVCDKGGFNDCNQIVESTLENKLCNVEVYGHKSKEQYIISKRFHGAINYVILYIIIWHLALRI